MKMPGFTAEESLYKTSSHYRAMGIESADPSHVIPQLRMGDSARYCLAVCLCCWGFDHPYCCYRCEKCLEPVIVAVGGREL
jgi:hypothetical protein